MATDHVPFLGACFQPVLQITTATTQPKDVRKRSTIFVTKQSFCATLKNKAPFFSSRSHKQQTQADEAERNQENEQK